MVEIDYNSTYDQTRQIIYKEIGCPDVPESNLLTLGCHFSRTPKKKVYDLANWDFIKQDYILEIEKKGANATINIILPVNVNILAFAINSS